MKLCLLAPLKAESRGKLRHNGQTDVLLRMRSFAMHEVYAGNAITSKAKDIRGEVNSGPAGRSSHCWPVSLLASSTGNSAGYSVERAGITDRLLYR